MINRDFKGVWIPKEIWLDDKLSWMEKLFIVEINSLDNDEGCFASNSYLGEFFNLSNGRVSQIIKSLLEKQYLSAEYEMEGKEVKRRILRILNTGIKNSKQLGIKNIKGGIKNIKEGCLENDKDNNTIFNNTINITNKIRSKEVEIEDFFESVWKLYPNKMGKNKVSKKSKKELIKVGFDKIRMAIERYSSIKPEWQSYQNGSTFFNGGYTDFLDENFSENKIEKTNSDSMYKLYTFD
jgi:hypothetical protein